MAKRITRRTFSTGLLAAGTLAASRQATFAKPGANERIRLGIIGCRSRGGQDAVGLLGTGSCEVATVCDCDTSKTDHAMKNMAQHQSATPKGEKDFRRVLEDKDIDAVVIATPDHWHAIMTLQALAAGKHVFVEKPASYCIAEGQAMVAAQKKHPDLTVCVGSQHRSGPHFKAVRDFIAGGGLGKVGFARAWITHDRGTIPIIPDSEPPAGLDYDMWLGPAPCRPYNKQRVHYNWHFMRDTGTNDTGNWGAHWLDSLRMSLDLDLPTAASGHAGIFVVHDAKEWHDTQTVIFEYPKLTVLWELRLWTKFGTQGRGGGIEIGGEKGSLIATRGGWTFYPKGDKPVEHPGSDQQKPHFQNFVDCIRGTAKPAADIETGHKSATLCHLANIVSLLGRRVVFDPKNQNFGNDQEANRLLGREYRAPWTLAV